LQDKLQGKSWMDWAAKAADAASTLLLSGLQVTWGTWRFLLSMVSAAVGATHCTCSVASLTTSLNKHLRYRSYLMAVRLASSLAFNFKAVPMRLAASVQHVHSMRSRPTSVCSAPQVAHVAMWPITTAVTVSFRLAAVPAAVVRTWISMVRIWFQITAPLIVAAIKPFMPGGKANMCMLWCFLKLVSIGAQRKSFPAYCFPLPAGCTWVRPRVFLVWDDL
jgi:hypothetical protein